MIVVLDVLRWIMMVAGLVLVGALVWTFFFAPTKGQKALFLAYAVAVGLNIGDQFLRLGEPMSFRFPFYALALILGSWGCWSYLHDVNEIRWPAPYWKDGKRRRASR